MKSDDIYVKTVATMAKLRKAKNSSHVRFEGCPVSVAEQVLFLVELGKVKSPWLSAESAIQMTKGYLQWRSATLFKRLRGERYQRPGPCVRGNASPELSK